MQSVAIKLYKICQTIQNPQLKKELYQIYLDLQEIIMTMSPEVAELEDTREEYSDYDSN